MSPQQFRNLYLVCHPAFRRGGLLCSAPIWPEGPFLRFKSGKPPDQLLPGIPASVQVLQICRRPVVDAEQIKQNR